MNLTQSKSGFHLCYSPRERNELNSSRRLQPDEFAMARACSSDSSPVELIEELCGKARE
jgi:hypothetical protein